MHQIDTVGYDSVHQSNFRYDFPEGFHNYILVITTTPAFFLIDNEITEYPPHTAILYPPNTRILYGAVGSSYGDHWVRFSCDESFVTSFPQQALPFAVSDPEYIRRLFQLLTWEDSQLIISQLLRILFNKLHDDVLNTEISVHDHELLTLRRKISTTPEDNWNISDMAAHLHISTGYLQFLYKQKFDISCMDDVIHFRTLKARDYLTYTSHTIAEIADMCGYNNTEHFCRQFHKIVGVSPGKYRKDAHTQILKKSAMTVIPN